MTSMTNEKAFEESIEQVLIERGGYVKGDPILFDRVMALDSTVFFSLSRIHKKTLGIVWL